MPINTQEGVQFSIPISSKYQLYHYADLECDVLRGTLEMSTTSALEIGVGFYYNNPERIYACQREEL